MTAAPPPRMTSQRPYLLRAIHAWIADNDMTPHLLVDATQRWQDCRRDMLTLMAGIPTVRSSINRLLQTDLLLDGERVMLETLLAFKRAGCDGILTYFAMDVARYLAKKG